MQMYPNETILQGRSVLEFDINHVTTPKNYFILLKINSCWGKKSYSEEINKVIILNKHMPLFEAFTFLISISGMQ